ncbi:MAG: aldo/keto reductase, partial [Nitrospiraceae bacterium]|nr:aldo/keto reductase [Nitrospiraceae bacterium]
LYWLHRDDPERPVGEIVDVLADWVSQGHIGAYGASNWTTARLEAALAYAREHGLPELSASQPGYAFAFHPTDPSVVSPMRYMDAESHAWHVRSRLPVAAYSAQATGFFGEANAAWAQGGFSGEAPVAAGYGLPENRERLTRAIDLAQRKGATASQIALAYLCHQAFPVYPIIGTSRAERIREAMAATRIALSGEEMAYLESGCALQA